MRFPGLFAALLALVLVPALASAAPAQQPSLVTDLSQSRIDISYRFAGVELLIFGAIQYSGGRLPTKSPGIAVVLRGPAEALTVRRKGRVAGIWVNRQSLRFESVPGFYAASTTSPVEQLLDERNAAIYEIGLPYLQLSPVTAAAPETVGMFQNGLVAYRQRRGLFVDQPYGVLVTDNILYRARIPIPSAVPVGNYKVEIYLIDNGKVAARATAPVIIDKSGFERALYVFAHEHGLLYGIVAIALAVAMGLAAGMLGRLRER